MSDLTYEIHLEKLTYGGDAMGRLPDGRAVFVPFGLPGELVRLRLTQEKQNFARGELIEIIKASPERVEPKCKHFTQCGGCHYQNLPYEKQLAAKTEILRDQLQRIGKIETPPVKAMQPSPLAWNYRNHMQFHLTKDGKLGFINSKGNSTFSIKECHLPEAGIHDFWRELQFEPNMNIERASLRCGQGDELMLVLESETDETPELEIEADISVVHIYEDHPVVIAGRDHFFINILNKDFRVSAASFFQVNTKMAEKMVEHLLACLPVSMSTNLLDVYCGAGLFSKFLASKYAKVICIESSPSACEDFGFNLDEFDNVELYEGTAEDILPAFAGLASPFGDFASVTHMIVDPPRAGIEKRALDAVTNIKPQVIAYVSCDPSTLARDAARLIHGGYRLVDVTPFDLFPQTYHIESISIFELM
ncbi:MAG: class I SAM-dependent RNA methyltransferase [Anaerolineales bacterium]|nr:class I SAM-dependent RNA methyltransferase [Anaerolineales bacterium]MDP2776688.1 class I SAM-dependent RNA methyltransferase [Anaerolineales bacterium]